MLESLFTRFKKTVAGATTALVLASGLTLAAPEAPANAAITWTASASMPDQPVAVYDLASGIRQNYYLSDGTQIKLHNEYIMFPCGNVFSTAWNMNQIPASAMTMAADEASKVMYLSGDPSGSTTDTRIAYISYDPTTYPAGNSCTGAPGSTNVTSNATFAQYVDTPIVSGSTRYSGMGRMVFNAATNKLYVANGANGRVFVLDTVTKTWVANITVGTNPWGLALDSTTNRVYVTNRGSNSVSVIDGTTDTVTSTISVGSTPRGISVDSVTHKVYVANSGTNSISEIDDTSLTVTQTVTTSGNPLDLAADGLSSYVYYMATNGNIGVVDLNDNYRNQLAAEGQFTPVISNNVGMNAATNRFWALTRNGVDTGMGSHPYTASVIFKPTIRSAAPPAAVRATSPGYQAYSYQMTATGTATILWQKTTGTLPPGLSVSSAGLISGTPTDYSDGSYTFTIRAYNQTYTGVYSEATYTVVVPPHPPQITTTSLPGATAGVAYSQTISSYFHPTFALRNGDSLPAGLTLTDNLNGTATISGTPTTGGTTNFRIIGTNGVAPDATRDYSITVTVSPPVIDTASISNCVFEEGTTQNWNFWGCVPYLASGSPSATFTISAGSLPSGLSFNNSTPGNERVYGTVNDVAGTAYSVSFRATNSSTNLYDEITLSGTIQASAPGQTWGQTYYAFEGVPFALDPKPSPRGTAPITWSTNGNEPSWTTLNTSTGFLTGTPGAGTAGQSTVFELTAQNAATVARGYAATDYPQIDVAAAPTQLQTITVAAGSTLAATTTDHAMGVASTCYLLPAGAVAPSWLQYDGCNDNDTGEFSGSVPANASGSYTFVVTYLDTYTWNRVGTLVTLNVTVPAPIVQATQTLNLVAGAAYSATVANTGGAVASWSLTSAPSGWAISSGGVLSGTVPVAGTYTFTVTATNSGGSSSMTVTLNSAAAPVIAPNISAGVYQTGVAMNYQIPATGAQPITFTAVSGLPGWASLSSSGVISGTPPSAGSYSVVVSLTNSAGGPVQSTITFTSAVAPTVASSLSIPTPTVGVAYSYQIPAPSAGTGPFTYSITGSLPAGLSLNSSTGVISGTPTTAGATSFSVVVSNGITVGTSSASSSVSTTVIVAAPVYTSAISQYVLAGSSVNHSPNYVSGSPATSWALATGSTLPAWLSLNSTTGALTGTAPAGAGTFSFSIEGQNAGGTATVTVTLTVQLVPAMAATATATNGSVGTAYSLTATPTGTGPFTFSVSAGSLPAGLSLNTSTGVISGTPTAIGSSSFTISAANGVGASSTAYSLAITPAVPSAPTISVTGATTATATIVPVAGATSYTVTSSPGGITCTVTAPATSCALTGLTSGIAYSFTATATGSSLTSTASAASTSVTPLAASGAPSAVASNGSATVTVASVTGATSYTLTASPGGATCTVVSPATSCVINGLANGTAYTFTQTATAGAYTTPASSASASATPQVAPPSTPAAPVATSTASGTATLTITPVAGATTYVLTASPGGATCTVTAPAISCNITGLTNGTAYTFSAVASNIAGSSSASVASTSLTTLAAPSAPTATSTVSGTAVVTPGVVAGATSYVVTASNGGGSCTVVSPATTCSITGLTAGTAYSFTSVAANGSVTSSASVASTSLTTLAAPSGITAVAGSGGATVTIGSPVTGATTYTVTAAPGGATCTVTAPATSCNVTGLTNGTAYTFTAVATGANASSSASTASSAVTPILAAPAAPTVTGTASNAAITASIASGVSINSISSGIATSYLVTASPGGATCTVVAPATTCQLTGLSNGTAYTLTAVAINTAGTSAASGASSAITPAAPPAIPAPTGSLSLPAGATAVTTAGGTLVTITGTNLGGSIVTIAGQLVTATINSTGTSLTFVAPAASVGVVPVAVTVAGALPLNLQLTYAAPPVVTPPAANGGSGSGAPLIRVAAPAANAATTSVSISGTNLAGATITVAGQTVAVQVNAAGTQASFILPASLRHGTHTLVVLSAAGLRTEATLVFEAPAALTTTLKVLFAVGSATLSDASKSAIKAFVVKNAKTMKSIALIGYVAAKPILASDLALSKLRAQAVAAQLKKLGVKVAITVKGAGRDAQSGPQSRRVEVVVTNK